MKNNLLKRKRRKTLVGIFKNKDKDTTREEQIQAASINYCDGNSGADARVRGAFVMGAYWSDDNPSDKIRRLKFKVTPDVYDTYKRGRKDATDNPTGGELLNAIEKGKNIGYGDATEIAALFVYHLTAHPNVHNIDGNELVKSFKEYMMKEHKDKPL